MTTAARTLGPTASRVLGALAWTAQAGMATTYATVIMQPDSWHAMYATDPTQTFTLWFYAAGMAIVWAGCLWQEQRSFYQRNMQDLFRRMGLLGHVSVLATALLASIAHPSRNSLLIALPVMSAFVVLMWITWMRSLFLPPEDQAVIDAIHSRQVQQETAAFDASQKEQRRSRLNAIVTSLGYQLAEEEQPAQRETEQPAIRWTVPSGKHAPLVYFIRNGNRIKIGTSTELKRRIRTLALRAENVALLLDGDRHLERQLHHQFADLRIGDTEWFADESPLTDFIADQNRNARKEEAK